MEDDEDTKAMKAKQQADAKAMKEAREKGAFIPVVCCVYFRDLKLLPSVEGYVCSSEDLDDILF